MVSPQSNTSIIHVTISLKTTAFSLYFLIYVPHCFVSFFQPESTTSSCYPLAEPVELLLLGCVKLTTFWQPLFPARRLREMRNLSSTGSLLAFEPLLLPGMSSRRHRGRSRVFPNFVFSEIYICVASTEVQIAPREEENSEALWPWRYSHSA